MNHHEPASPFLSHTRCPRSQRRRSQAKISLSFLEPLESRQLLTATALGAPFGSPPIIRVLNEDGSLQAELLAFDNRFRGGVNVAVGDVNNDGTPDVVAAMARRGGQVSVFDGATLELLATLSPYGTNFRGGVTIAVGHLFYGGGGDIITGTASGRPVVKVFDGATNSELMRFLPYKQNVSGVQIVTGTGAGQSRTISANSTDTLTISQAWTTTPDASSGFVIEPPNPRSWFEVLNDGVQAGERVPIGSVPGGPTTTFTDTLTGLSTYPWYPQWFYNSINTFQTLDGLSNLLTQYDTGLPSGNAFTWSQQWPGAKLDVPLLLTELGFSRFNITAQAQSDIIANEQAQIATNVLKTSQNLMGFTIFEFNDEPNKNGTTGPPFSEAFFGITYYNANQNDFRNGTLLYNLQTGTTPWAGGTLPNLLYPVFQLTPVSSGSGTLLARLKSIFAQLP